MEKYFFSHKKYYYNDEDTDKKCYDTSRKIEVYI